MVFAAVLAGGTGRRMQTENELPKQFLPLNNKPVLVYSLECFLKCPDIDKIYLAAPDGWMEYTETLLKEFGASGEIELVSGGDTRNASIMNVISVVESEFGCGDEHILVTHDAARPFVSLEMINDNVDAALQYGAAGTVLPAVDTMLISNGGDFILSVPDRESVYHSQTPQSFCIKEFKRIFEKLSDTEKEKMTDACKICVSGGMKVKMVLGSPSNFKITTAGDYEHAKTMVKK